MGYSNNNLNKQFNKTRQSKNIINNIDEIFKQNINTTLIKEPITKEDFKQLEDKHNEEFNQKNFLFPKPNTNYDPNEPFQNDNEERKKTLTNDITSSILSIALNNNARMVPPSFFMPSNAMCKCNDCNIIMPNKLFNNVSMPPPIALGDTLQNLGNHNPLEKTQNNKKYIIEIETITIDVEINTLDDLINMINSNPIIENAKYNIDMTSLYKIKPYLIQLKNMIGMNELKNSVIEQIIYFSQNLHKINNTNEGDFMHTVIYGPPGTGKTEVAKILGKIFCNLGVLQNGKFKKVTRSDLIAGYLGQTAIKTREVITSSMGGVLFIDEAYALGNTGNKDTFSKECIDTLCEALSDHKDKIMVIIAGYEKELDECFFKYNQGLNSRFTWRFKTDDYTGDDLMNIFIKKINENGWSLHEASDINVKWFEDNLKYFKFYGRDMETLFTKTKIAHSHRVFCKPNEEKTKINKTDLDKGFKMFLNNDGAKHLKNNNEIDNVIQYSMYN